MGFSPKGPRFRVVVTQDVIDRSVKRDSKHCMIAEGIKSVFPNARHIAVDVATIRFSDPDTGLRYTYLTPRGAQKEIVKFDQGESTQPFRFELRGAQITESKSTNNIKKKLTEKQIKAYDENARKMREVLRSGSLRAPTGNGTVPDRLGGDPPPLQRNGDGLPFSRRRAFGLRALRY